MARTARIRGGNAGGSEHRAGGDSCHRPARRLPYEPLGEGAGSQGAMAGVAPARSHGGRLGAGLTSRAFYATRLAAEPGAYLNGVKLLLGAKGGQCMADP